MAKTNHWGALAAAAGTLVAVGLVVLIMVVVVEAPPAEATFPGKNGKIAFVRDRGLLGAHIYTINPLDGRRIHWSSVILQKGIFAHRSQADEVSRKGPGA